MLEQTVPNSSLKLERSGTKCIHRPYQVADAQTNSTVAPAAVTATAAANVTVKVNNGCGRMDAFSPLLPLLLAAHILRGWLY